MRRLILAAFVLVPTVALAQPKTAPASAPPRPTIADEASAAQQTVADLMRVMVQQRAQIVAALAAMAAAIHAFAFILDNLSGMIFLPRQTHPLRDEPRTFRDCEISPME